MYVYDTTSFPEVTVAHQVYHTAILNAIISVIFESYVIVVTWTRTINVLRALRKASPKHAMGVTYLVLRDGNVSACGRNDDS